MKRFRNIARLTVGAVLFLIVIGGIVRMTGSGMGCPDWPKCFGQIVPPTDISELPVDYKTRFAVQGKEIADFDPFKTWVEYINRLFGVLIGLFSLLTVVFAARIRKQVPRALWWSLGGLFFVILAGGVGAIVVLTDLHSGTITIHMVIALLTVLCFLMATFTVADIRRVQAVELPQAVWISAGMLILFTLIQIIMGTQVREQVDEIAKQMGEASRGDWIDALTGVYHLHKVFHYGIFLLLIGLTVQLRKFRAHLGPVRNMLVFNFLLLMMEATVGIGMHNLGIPAWLQPLHLLLAALIFAAEIGLMGWLLMARMKVPEKNHLSSH